MPEVINFQLDALQQSIGEIKDMPQPVILHCAGGVRSNIGVSFLKQNVFDNTVEGGGIED